MSIKSKIKDKIIASKKPEVEEILKRLQEEGKITSPTDLTGDEEPTVLFYMLLKSFSQFLDAESKFGTPEDNLKIRKLFNKLIRLFGPFLLKNQKIISNEYVPDGKPVIYVMNHAFKDDALATILAIKEHASIFLASLPAIFNSLDGILVYLESCAVINRKTPDNNQAGAEKGINIIKLGNSLILCPERVHNKTADEIILHLARGAAVFQQKSGAPIVPIIHYTEDSLDKLKPIYTSVGKPLIFEGNTKVCYTTMDDLISISEGKTKPSDYYSKEEKDKNAANFETELLRNIMATQYMDNMFRYYDDCGFRKDCKICTDDEGESYYYFHDSTDTLLAKYGMSGGEGALNAAWEEWLKDYRKSIPCYDTPIEVAAHYTPKITFSWLSKQLDKKYDPLNTQFNYYVPVMGEKEKRNMLEELGLDDSLDNGGLSYKDLYHYYCIRFWELAKEKGIDGIFMNPIKELSFELDVDESQSLTIQNGGSGSEISLNEKIEKGTVLVRRPSYTSLELQKKV